MLSARLRSIRGIILMSLFLLPAAIEASDADSVILYTPYTRITVGPGQSIDYSVDLINNGKNVVTADLGLSGIPRNWAYSLKANNFNITQLSVLPGERKNVTFMLEVPLQINKGSYRFSLTAGSFATLPLTVVVSEQGTFRTDFTTNQANMQGASASTFNYQTELYNRTAEKQAYALMANAPAGWNVSFTANYKKTTSVEVEPNSKIDVTVEIDPPDVVEAKLYKIPVRATTGSTSATLDLEAVITGTYGIELTTPTGLLSASITAGEEKRIDLIVKNTGSAELIDIKFDQANPIGWEVSYDPKSIPALQPGGFSKVTAIIKASKKAIAGDYVTTIEAKAPEVTASAAFRLSVKTPLIYGWVGILIILAGGGAVYYLFRKYGRR